MTATTTPATGTWLSRDEVPRPVLRTHVSDANWREVRGYWAALCSAYGWEGRARTFLEVGRAELFGCEVDDDFCASRVADLIGETLALSAAEGVDFA